MASFIQMGSTAFRNLVHRKARRTRRGELSTHCHGPVKGNLKDTNSLPPSSTAVLVRWPTAWPPGPGPILYLLPPHQGATYHC